MEIVFYAAEKINVVTKINLIMGKIPFFNIGIS